MKKEIWHQEIKNKVLRQEFDVVEWYTRVLEDGVDTKNLCIEMSKTKEINRKLMEKIEKMTLEHRIESTELRKKLKETKFHLKKQNTEVVKPLMQEINLVQEIKQRYKTQYEKNFEDLRILNSIVRLPRMSDQFQKTIMRKEKE